MTTRRSFRWGLALAALPLCILLAWAAYAQEAPPEVEDRTTVLFRIGLAALAEAEQSDDEAIRQRLYDKAIVAFRMILVNRPDLVRVRLELARAFFLKGQDGLARRHFELVLAGGVPPPVAANILNFLNAMQARKRFTGYFGAAVAPDSNLNAASESEIIYIDTVFGRLPFTREGDFGAQSGLGLSVWGGGEYQYPLSERLRLRAGADVAQREYGGSDFDQLFIAAHTGPRWLASPITEISLLATAQRQWLGGVPYADELGARLELDRRLTSRLWARGTAAYRERSHRARVFLDGPVADFTATLAWTPAPVLRVHWTVGYERPPRGVGTLAHPVALAAGGHLAGPAARIHAGHQRPDAAHALRRQRRAAPDDRPQAALRPHPHVHDFGAQPRLHAVPFQPAVGPRSRSAPDQRAGAGLRAQPRRAALRAAVLKGGAGNSVSLIAVFA